MAASSFEELKTELNEKILTEYQDKENKKDLDLCLKRTLKNIEERIKPLLNSAQQIKVKTINDRLQTTSPIWGTKTERS